MFATNRRKILFAVGSSAVAGCLSRESDDDSVGLRLGEVWLANAHEEPVAFELRVEWENETVHDESYEIAGAPPEDGYTSGRGVEPTWPREPGQFALSVRRPGEEWWSRSADELHGEGCYLPVVINREPASETPKSGSAFDVLSMPADSDCERDD